jgi:hypothetical protein
MVCQKTPVKIILSEEIYKHLGVRWWKGNYHLYHYIIIIVFIVIIVYSSLQMGLTDTLEMYQMP